MSLKAYSNFFLLIGFCSLYTPTHGIDSYPYLLEYRRPHKLNFQAGDVIACVMSDIASTLGKAEHLMLAVSSYKVAHIVMDGEKSVGGILKEDYFKSMAERKNYRECRVATSQYDRIMMEFGVPPKEISEALSTARIYIGSRMRYHFTGCNCQHWVTYWKYGFAWSPQSNQGPDRECFMTNDIRRVNAHTYNQNLQLAAQASAGTGEVRWGFGAVNARASGPRAGVNAEVGLDRTGAGFEAGVGDARFSLGKVVGVSAGLKADTKVGVGADGATLQVLGTGWEVSRSRGTKLCILGSCVHFG